MGDGDSGRGAIIGTDVGGTHTDVAVVLDGQLVRGKALTTHHEYSAGLLDAIAVAAHELGLSLTELLGRADALINGTTVVTNTITELRGSRVGVLMTEGFTDTLRLAGGARRNDVDDHAHPNVPDLVARQAIVGIQERIDWSGRVLVPLDLDAVADAARHLVEDQHVEALAICFLSSFANGEHELAALRAVAEIYPDLFVTPSHRVFPVAGETRRFTTAVLNSYVHQRAVEYLTSLSARLGDAGLRCGVTFFQGLGGAISLERASEYPLSLLGSGPAAGAIGANELAKAMGRKRALIGDMGGTSFDTGIIVDNEVRVEKNLQIGPFQTGVNIVDVISVGAGGGSLATASPRGVPAVGPQSAGSDPGPAAYGKGGTQPTVTDAMIHLGLIDPERYLGGRVELRADLAERALAPLAERFGWTVDEAAAAVHDLVVVNMSTAMREVSVQKGHDPREFLFLAYGGTLPLFASEAAARLDMSTAVIPANSSVFCALGLLSSDFVLRLDHGVGWTLGDADDVARVNEVAQRTVTAALSSMEAEGFGPDEVTLVRTADCRFQGQAYELTLRLPDRELSPDDGPALADDFRALYEGTYGEGTAWEGVDTTMINVSVTATAPRPRPRIAASAAGTAAGPVRERDVFLPSLRTRERIPVYEDAGLPPGASVEGPAIVDATDTTIFVPPGVTATRDEFLNYLLTR
jgi:N-methylhydantoinase A